MSIPHVQYLLVGGGIAAASAAAAIRARDHAGLIMLVGQENSRPYQRPALSKQFLRDELSRESLFIKPGGWFADQHIELHTGHRVAAVDVSRHSVALETGKEISFDHLLLATGASPKVLDIPGAALPNVYYLRTLEDTDRLRTIVDQARRAGRPHPSDGGLPRNTTTGRGRAAIIGGGLLGVELAASLSRMGMAVDLLIATPIPWNHIAGEVAGKFITRLLEHRGVTVHLSTTALRLEGDGRVQRVQLSNGGAIDTDFVVGAIGSTVNRQILRGTSIRAEKAILTDEHCRTNISNVYAAGDCAAVFDPAVGKHRIGHHWTQAEITGRIAGDNMAGGNAAYDAVPQFDSEIFGRSIRVFGDARQVDRRIIRGTPNLESPNFLEIGVAAEGTVVQVIAFGQDHEFDTLESLVKQRTPVNGNEEQLKDPAGPLGDL